MLLLICAAVLVGVTGAYLFLRGKSFYSRLSLSGLVMMFCSVVGLGWILSLLMTYYSSKS